MFAVLTEGKVLLIFSLNRVNNKLVFVRAEFIEKSGGTNSKVKISKCGSVIGVSTRGSATPMAIYDSFMHKLPGLVNASNSITPKNYQEEPVGVVSFDFIRKKVYDKLRLCTAHRDSKLFVWGYSGLTDGWTKMQSLNLAKQS